MDQVHSTTEHRKGKHLSFEERVVIQTRLKDGWTPNRIAEELGCTPNTVRNEVKRGTVILYRGNIFRYRAKVGQAAYEKNRKTCCRHYDFPEKLHRSHKTARVRENKRVLGRSIKDRTEFGHWEANLVIGSKKR